MRDNIARFGGDSAKVTIGGESAGSISVSGLIVRSRFNYVIPGNPMEALGAYYSSKMAYAFNSGAVRGAKNKKMAQEMHTRWVNFIKNGDPNIGAAPPTAAQWPQYDPEKAEVMIFDSEVRAAPLPAVELPGERAGRRQ